MDSGDIAGPLFGQTSIIYEGRGVKPEFGNRRKKKMSYVFEEIVPDIH